MLVLTKKDLTAKFGGIKVRKGQIFPFDPVTSSIIINTGKPSMQIYLGVKMGKDIQELDWVKVSKTGRIIQNSPGEGLTFVRNKKQKNERANSY